MRKKEKKDNSWILIIVVLVILGFVVSLIAALVTLFVGTSQGFGLTGGKIAVIHIDGIITSQDAGAFGSPESLTADEIVGFIEDAEKDKSIKGILLDINTPGGEVYASSIISDALNKVNKTKVALIRSLGASGGYWIALHAEYIVAHKYSITGSVGVISSYPEFDEFLSRYNISYNRLVAGELKDIGDPFTELTDEKRNILQMQLDAIHNDFLTLLKDNRDITDEHMEVIQTGRFFLGSEAKKLNLIDQLGGEKEAKKYLEKKLNISKPIYTDYKKDVSFLDMLSGEVRQAAYSAGEGISAGLRLVKTYNYYMIMT